MTRIVQNAAVDNGSEFPTLPSSGPCDGGLCCEQRDGGLWELSAVRLATQDAGVVMCRLVMVAQPSVARPPLGSPSSCVLHTARARQSQPSESGGSLPLFQMTCCRHDGQKEKCVKAQSPHEEEPTCSLVQFVFNGKE